MLYTYYKHVLGKEAPIAKFVSIAEVTVCIRPGLRAFYDSVLALKRSGLVHSIVMCTAAPNTVGWVSFLRELLETWYGASVYDHVIDGTMIRGWHAALGSRDCDDRGISIKDMNQIRAIVRVPDTTPVLMFDDNPANVLFGHVRACKHGGGDL